MAQNIPRKTRNRSHQPQVLVQKSLQGNLNRSSYSSGLYTHYTDRSGYSIPERPTSPKIVPKSILRVSSPDGQRPPRRIIAYPAPPTHTENGQQPSTGQSPLSPLEQTLPGIAENDSPGSAPSSPITRPLSPGATVRFAKATIHRVEVGPGRRFAPVKRKSKSTITYIAPLDPGAHKATPKNMLASPTKLRRHVENQKAMGRYWMRTEEEEAQWRAEAAMRAAEEAERYRAEPASPPGPAVLTGSPAFHGFSWADGLDALDKLPPIDSLPSLDKLETEEAEDKLETVVSDSDDSDTEFRDSGVNIFPMDGDQEDRSKLPIRVKQDRTKGTELGHQGAGEPSQTSPSEEAKTGEDGAQEVNNAKATINSSSQEAKTALARPSLHRVMTARTPAPAETSSPQLDPKQKTNGTSTATVKSSPAHTRSPSTTAATSRPISIPTLTLSPSRPTSPTPRRISPQRPLSASPSPPFHSRSLPTSAVMDNTSRSLAASSNSGGGGGGTYGRERPNSPSLRSSSVNRLHLSGRRDRVASSSGGAGRKVLFDDDHVDQEIAVS